MRSDPSVGAANPDKPTWQQMVAKYQNPSLQRSLWQVANTLIPYIVLLTLMYVSLSYSYWLSLALALPAGGLLTRAFIIFHDCGHGSFFKSQRANNFLGTICGLLVFTPYYQWRFEHAIHHATSGDLDRRGLGAIETLTVAEYRGLPGFKRLGYRLYRHPLVMLGLGPAYMFLLQHRLPIGAIQEGWAWRSVLANNLGLALLAAVLVPFVGLRTMLIAHLPVVVLAAIVGVGLFYVQHQFERCRWMRHRAWTATAAALEGSSYLLLPQPFRWLTANIGLHHVHHAASRVPFYRLPAALDAHPALTMVPRLAARDIVAAFGLGLWDELSGRLVSFDEARKDVASRGRASPQDRGVDGWSEWSPRRSASSRNLAAFSSSQRRSGP